MDTLWEWHLTVRVLSSGDWGLWNMWPESSLQSSPCVVWLLYASQNKLAYFQGLKQQEGIERVYYDDMFKAKKNKSTGNEWNVSLKQDVNFSFKNIWLVDLVIYQVLSNDLESKTNTEDKVHLLLVTRLNCDASIFKGWKMNKLFSYPLMDCIYYWNFL